jgi:hypothetical protein
MRAIQAVTCVCAASSGASAAPDDGIAIGDEVEIAADDYAFEPSAGRLVHCGPNELVIARRDARAGDVAVHFPRLGYRMTRR